MSIKFFNQWLQWINDGSWNWSEFDLINLSFERDKVAGDWRIDAALFGMGFIVTYMTKEGAEKWEKIMKEHDNE